MHPGDNRRTAHQNIRGWCALDALDVQFRRVADRLTWMPGARPRRTAAFSCAALAGAAVMAAWSTWEKPPIQKATEQLESRHRELGEAAPQWQAEGLVVSPTRRSKLPWGTRWSARIRCRVIQVCHWPASVPMPPNMRAPRGLMPCRSSGCPASGASGAMSSRASTRSGSRLAQAAAKGEPPLIATMMTLCIEKGTGSSAWVKAQCHHGCQPGRRGHSW